MKCAFQATAFSARDEMRSSVAVAERVDSVVCPKPRRLGLLSAAEHPVRPLRWYHSYQSELYDSKTGSDLLDILLTKGGCGVAEQQPCIQVASSPPFFCGSPPSRVSNPLIQDARFGDEKLLSSPLSPAPTPFVSSPARKGGCVRGNYGNKPVVRIEGFDCLDRDSRNCSIPALA